MGLSLLSSTDFLLWLAAAEAIVTARKTMSGIKRRADKGNNQEAKVNVKGNFHYTIKIYRLYSQARKVNQLTVNGKHNILVLGGDIRRLVGGLQLFLGCQ